MKDTFYFQHEINARWDQKLVKLQMVHGMAGIGVYWCIVEMLYENTGYLPLEYERITFELRTDKNVIRSVINDFDLFQNDGVKFWSENALMQFNARIAKSVKASDSVKKRWNKYYRNTTVIQTYNDSNTKEERRGEEIRGEELPPPEFGKSLTVMTEKDLRQVFEGEIQIEEWCMKTHSNIDQFTKFMKQWVENKVLTGNYHYQKHQLKAFMLADWEKEKKEIAKLPKSNTPKLYKAPPIPAGYEQAK